VHDERRQGRSSLILLDQVERTLASCRTLNGRGLAADGDRQRIALVVS